MDERFLRTEMLLGPQAMERLAAAHVAVFGLGGVGSWCAEALARSGVGALTLIDHDEVGLTNLNRQAEATVSTLGRPKAQAMAERAADINPECRLTVLTEKYEPETRERFFGTRYDYVVDCIDTVAAKLELVTRCTALQVRIVSAMGSGNKLDPTAFEVSDLSKTQGCPLARVMRKELRRRGISHLKVVWSREEPRSPLRPMEAEPPASASETRPGSTARRDTPGSISFVPAAAGLVLASAVVRDLGQF